GDDLMLAFLDRDELAELRRLRDLALPNRFRVWLKDAQHLIGYVRVTAEQPRARLREHACHQRLHLLQLLTGLGQRRRDRSRGSPETLADTTDHRPRVADHRTRRGHQPTVAADQVGPRLRRSRLPPDDEHATPDAAAPITDASAPVTQRRTGPLHRARQ